MTLDLEVAVKKGLSKFSTFFSNPFISAIVIVAVVILISSATQSPIKVIFWSTITTTAIMLMHDHANASKVDEGVPFAFATTGTKVDGVEFVKIPATGAGEDTSVSSMLGREPNKIKIPQLKGLGEHPIIA
jgi:hypothetical protein